MTEALQIIPQKTDVHTGVGETAAIAEKLADVLADTYRLIFKTHGYHWNVVGPMFYSVHNLTEGQYQDMFAAADVLAERIRALGHLAPSQMSDVMKRSEITDQDSLPDAGTMVSDLAKDHETIAKRLHELVELAGEHHDPVTEDLATARSAFHEKAAWMLRAMADQTTG